MGAKIGSNIAVVAIFEVISVKKFTAAITTNKMMNNEKPLSWVKFSAIQLANPLD